MKKNQKEKRLRELDRKNIWHPFTQMEGWMEEEFPVIEAGKGSYLFDVSGNIYIDGVSSLWCNVHGHQVKAIDDAIREQLKKIGHSTMLGLAHESSIKLAELLIKISPKKLQKVFFSDSGSEAVEVGLKMAYQYWKLKGRPLKDTFVSLGDAYHGDTIGSVSVGGIDIFHRIFSKMLFNKYTINPPYFHKKSRGLSLTKAEGVTLNAINELFIKKRDRISAFIIEPLVQGAAGILTHSPMFLKKVESLCRKNDILLIVDEVATGFGRTGKLFACNHKNINPDILCLGKGITGGYLPLSATLTSEKIFNAFLGRHEEFKTFFHGHTYAGNPLASVSGIASIKLMLRKGYMDRICVRVNLMKELLKEFRTISIVGDIRQCGLMAGIELVKNRKVMKPFPISDRFGHQVTLEARKRGVIIRPLGDVIVLMPPLNIPLDALKKLIKVVKKAIVVAHNRAYG